KSADVAPIERQRATAGDEERAGVADVQIELVRRTVFARLLVKLERLGKAVVVDERLHVPRVEENPLRSTLRLDKRAGDGGNEPIGLLVARLGDAGSIIR